MTTSTVRPSQEYGRSCMIRSAEFSDFRCFKREHLKDCRAINIVLGKNASGKTALLEGLFLALGPSPEQAQRLRAWRGMPSNILNENPAVDWLIWNDLFYNLQPNCTPSISLSGSGAQNRDLTIRYDENDTVQAIQQPGGGLLTVPVLPISFTYLPPGGVKSVVRAVKTGGPNLQYVGSQPVTTEVVMFASQIALNIQEIVDRYSVLVRSGDEASLKKAIVEEFPLIKDIDVASTGLGPSSLFIDTGLKERIPLGLVSGGVTKIVSILLAISVFEGGVILIDEIENGVFFERYPSLWKSIRKFAVDHDVQVFASTHSEECLQALAGAAREGKWEEDVSFVRTFEDKDGKHIEQFSGSTMFNAMKKRDIRKS